MIAQLDVDWLTPAKRSLCSTGIGSTTWSTGVTIDIAPSGDTDFMVEFPCLGVYNTRRYEFTFSGAADLARALIDEAIQVGRAEGAVFPDGAPLFPAAWAEASLRSSEGSESFSTMIWSASSPRALPSSWRATATAAA